jgi:hypothetical protein
MTEAGWKIDRHSLAVASANAPEAKAITRRPLERICGLGGVDIDCCWEESSISDGLSMAARELMKNHLLLSSIYDITGLGSPSTFKGIG